MLHLEASGLRVSVLDPVADRARLGSRYVAGGYIWQVEDEAKGNLLSGPAYPKPDPGGFDGQGLPEVFEIALGQHLARPGEDVFVIGVGRVKRESPVKPFHVRNNPGVAEFAAWTVDASPASVTMVSEQAFRDWSLRIVRRVRIAGRMVESSTRIANTGAAELPLRWFAHPFFPHGGLECFAFSRENAFPSWVQEAGGFEYDSRGWIRRKSAYEWRKGCYQLVQAPFGYPLEALVRHPLLGEVRVECDFPLAFLPIWANENTMSFEPYLQTQVLPGASYSWAMRYHF